MNTDWLNIAAVIIAALIQVFGGWKIAAWSQKNQQATRNPLYAAKSENIARKTISIKELRKILFVLIFLMIFIAIALFSNLRDHSPATRWDVFNISLLTICLAVNAVLGVIIANILKHSQRQMAIRDGRPEVACDRAERENQKARDDAIAQ